MNKAKLTYNDLTENVYVWDDELHPRKSIDLRRHGAGMTFRLSATDDVYEKLVGRTPLLTENDYKEFGDIKACGDYIEYFDVTIYEDKAVEVMISNFQSERCFRVPLSESEKSDFYTFISRFCKEQMKQSLDDMLAESKEANYKKFTYDDIAKGVYSLNTPMCVFNNNNVALEWDVMASDDIYKEFVKRTSMLRVNHCDSIDDLIDCYFGDGIEEHGGGSAYRNYGNYLEIYATVCEDKSVRAVIGLFESNGCYSVPLSDSEQKDFYAFASQFCSERTGRNLDDMLAGMREEINEMTDEKEISEAFFCNPYYCAHDGKEIIEDPNPKGKTSEIRDDVER